MPDSAAVRSDDDAVLDALTSAVGPGGVATDPATLRRYGSDLHRLALLRATKDHLDPDGLINPGVLGLT